MSHCHEMKLGEVYVCEDCGLELQVVKECDEAGTPIDECVCGPCELSCCDLPLVKKEPA